MDFCITLKLKKKKQCINVMLGIVISLTLFLSFYACFKRFFSLSPFYFCLFGTILRSESNLKTEKKIIHTACTVLFILIAINTAISY